MWNILDNFPSHLKIRNLYVETTLHNKPVCGRMPVLVEKGKFPASPRQIFLDMQIFPTGTGKHMNVKLYCSVECI